MEITGISRMSFWTPTPAQSNIFKKIKISLVITVMHLSGTTPTVARRFSDCGNTEFAQQFECILKEIYAIGWFALFRGQDNWWSMPFKAYRHTGTLYKTSASVSVDSIELSNDTLVTSRQNS